MRTWYLSGAICFFVCVSAYADVIDYGGLVIEGDRFEQILVSQETLVKSDLTYLQSALDAMDPESLKDRAAKLRGGADRCEQRMARREISSCTVSSRGAQISVEQARARANAYEKKCTQCEPSHAQAALDARALQDRLRQIGTIRTAFAQWKEERDAAVRDEVKSAAMTTLGVYAEVLTQQATSASALKGWITRYRQELSASGLDATDVLAHLAVTESKYQKALDAVARGKALQSVDVPNVVASFQSTAGLVGEVEATDNASIRAFMDDPRVKKIIITDKPLYDMGGLAGTALLEAALKKAPIAKFLRLTAQQGKKIVPAVAISAFLVDTAFNGCKWYVSLEQLRMRVDNAESSQKAAVSLHKLVERRKSQWKDCLN